MNELLAASRARLTPTATVVRRPDGRVEIESKDASQVCPEEVSAAGQMFFVAETSPDEAIVEVCDGVFIGSQDGAANIDALRNAKITHVINAASHCVPNYFPENFSYLPISVLDNSADGILDYLPLCNRYIQNAIDCGGAVLVHCQAGVSRSSAIVCGFLLKSQKVRDVSRVLSCSLTWVDMWSRRHHSMRHYRLFGNLGRRRTLILISDRNL